MTIDLPQIPVVERFVVEMTNTLREEKKLGEVHSNAQLRAAATAYADYLAKSKTFSHTADGRQAGDRISEAGYHWCTVGENLAAHLNSEGFQSRELARLAIEGWLNSPGHRDNLLAPHVTDIGVGIARAPDQHPKYIIVQLFARPKSLSYTFQISNAAKLPITYTFGGETHELKSGAGVQHQACIPSTLTFDKAGAGGKAKPVGGRYKAADGHVYVLKPDKAKGIVVEIEPLQRVR